MSIRSLIALTLFVSNVALAAPDSEIVGRVLRVRDDLALLAVPIDAKERKVLERLRFRSVSSEALADDRRMSKSHVFREYRIADPTLVLRLKRLKSTERVRVRVRLDESRATITGVTPASKRAKP